MKNLLIAILAGMVSAVIIFFSVLATAGGGEADLDAVSTNGWNDAAWVHMKADRYTRAFERVEYEHHEIHAGKSFWYSDFLDNLNGSQDYIITTPNTTSWAHLTYEVDTTGSTTIEIYEDTARAGTDAQTEYNRDRNSATVNTTTIHKNSGAGADGTKIIYRSTGSRNASTQREAKELILLQNKKYIFRLTTAAPQDVSVVLSWYELVNQS